MNTYFLGCDWGTSSFRLSLYNLQEKKLVDMVSSAEGVATIHRNWQTNDFTGEGIAKDQLFRSVLQKHIAALSSNTGLQLKDTTIVISGMASSSIGMETIAYADLPFALDGRQVKTKLLTPQTGFPHTIILVSGVQSAKDVMRGEETQLIGSWSLLNQQGLQLAEEAIFIFPGTHSKHIYIKDKQLTDFKTYMTGELYQVMGSHSILKDSIQLQEEKANAGDALQAFAKGVRTAAETGLLNALFTVRTNQLFKKLDSTHNAHYLSGLLIGNELQELVAKKEMPLFLCSGQHLYPLYKRAMEELGLANRTSFIEPQLVETAALTGQEIIYDLYLKNTLLHA